MIDAAAVQCESNATKWRRLSRNGGRMARTVVKPQSVFQTIRHSRSITADHSGQIADWISGWLSDGAGGYFRQVRPGLPGQAGWAQI